MENNKKGQLSFQSLLISALVIGIFIFAIFSFNSNLSTSTGSANNILNDNNLSRHFDNINTSLDASFGNITNEEGGFFQGVPFLEGAETVLLTIFRTVPNLFSVAKTMYLATMDILTEVLGIPAIVINLLMAILTILGILLGWRVYKAGS